MKKIDWKRKLTSRKFWMAVAGSAAPLAIAFGAPKNADSEITALIMSGASCIAYIIGEGLVDAETSVVPINNSEEKNA